MERRPHPSMTPEDIAADYEHYSEMFSLACMALERIASPQNTLDNIQKDAAGTLEALHKLNASYQDKRGSAKG
jgi:hypothetical protein